jgi:hypothetical protein
MSNGNSWAGFGLILLGLIMIILKVTGWLDWSWWLVFLPLYFPFAVSIGLLLLFLIGGFAVLVVIAVVGLTVGIYEALTEKK